MKLLGPLIAKKTKTVEKNCKVIFLLRSNYIGKRIEGPVFMTADSCSDILSHVEGSSILTEKDLLVKTDW